jgi:hypothetical protein
VDQDARVGVGHDADQLVRGQPPIQRHCDRAKIRAGAQHLENAGVVPGQHGDAISLTQAVPLLQRPGQGAHALRQLVVVRLSAAVQFDQSNSVGCSLCVVRDPRDDCWPIGLTVDRS